MHFQDLPHVLQLKKLAGGAWIMKNLHKGSVFFESGELVQYNQSQEIFRRWERGELNVQQAIDEMLSIPIVRHALGALHQMDHSLSQEEYIAYYGRSERTDDDMTISDLSGLANKESRGIIRKQPSSDYPEFSNASKRVKPL